MARPPTILITSAEHYGAVMNLDFDYRKYLDTLAADGMNYTRVFSGAYVEPQGAFNIARNTLAPAAGPVHRPWARSDQPGYANGGNKFDLARWDDAYFAGSKDFVAYAATKNIVVELTLFCPMYEEMQWKLSPMNAANNVNGVGTVARTDVYTLDKHGGLLAVQEALTRKIVTELNGFDNLFFEICNEPYFGGVTIAWQHRIADVIVETERGLPAKHLIAQNIANKSAKIVNPHPAVSIFNFHYATPPDAVGLNYALNKVIGDDETGFRGTTDAPYRTEAWDFIIAGGGLYNNLDYSFAAGHEDGTFEYPASQPGGGNRCVSPADEDSERLHQRLRFRPHVAGQLGDQGRRSGRRHGARAGRARQGDGDLRAEGERDRTVVGALDRVHRGAVERRVHVPHVFQRRHSPPGERRRSLIEDWTDHGEKEDAGRITLTAGQRYAVRLEYFYNGGQGVSKLWWTPPGGTKEAVPATRPPPAGGRPGTAWRVLQGRRPVRGLGAARRRAGQLCLGREAAALRPSQPVPLPSQIELTDGVWQAEWLDTKSGDVVRRTRVDGGGDPHVRGAGLRDGHRASPEATVASFQLPASSSSSQFSNRGLASWHC